MGFTLTAYGAQLAEMLKAVAMERADCAAIARGAGCACDELDGAVHGPADSGPCRYCHIEHVGACSRAPAFPGQLPTRYLPNDVLLAHDPRCPESIALAIETRGKDLNHG